LSTAIQLVVGLGNPGPEYEQTRHNAGFWFADAVARAAGARFRRERKFHGDVCKAQLAGHSFWLLKPETYMNHSGQAIAALARFYKIPAAQILIAHDELDLPPGGVKLKIAGGHAGHNGLRDTINRLGSGDFSRLRLGVGHPGSAGEVVGYVLGRPSAADRAAMEAAIDASVEALPLILEGEIQRAMSRLHSR